MTKNAASVMHASIHSHIINYTMISGIYHSTIFIGHVTDINSGSKMVEKAGHFIAVEKCDLLCVYLRKNIQ